MTCPSSEHSKRSEHVFDSHGSTDLAARTCSGVIRFQENHFLLQQAMPLRVSDMLGTLCAIYRWHVRLFTSCNGGDGIITLPSVLAAVKRV